MSLGPVDLDVGVLPERVEALALDLGDALEAVAAARSSVRLTRRTRSPGGALVGVVVAEQLRHARRDAGLGVEEEDDAALVLLDAGLDAVAQLGLDRVLHAAGQARCRSSACAARAGRACRRRTGRPARARTRPCARRRAGRRAPFGRGRCVTSSEAIASSACAGQQRDLVGDRGEVAPVQRDEALGAQRDDRAARRAKRHRALEDAGAHVEHALVVQQLGLRRARAAPRRRTGA